MPSIAPSFVSTIKSPQYPHQIEFNKAFTSYINARYSDAARQFYIAWGLGNSTVSMIGQALALPTRKLVQSNVGDEADEFSSGLMYLFGCGVEQDDKQAIALFKLSADQSNAEAQNILGFMYASGRVVGAEGLVSNQESVKWYRLSEGQGNAAAQNGLAWMHQEGLGVDGTREENDREAVRLYWQSAKQGNADAQANLAAMYQAGRGVDGTEEEKSWQAVQLFQQSVAQGNTDAMFYLGKMYQDGLVADSPGEGNDRLAFKYFQLGANQGCAVSQAWLARMYQEGRVAGSSEESNDREAVKWYQLSADQGNAQPAWDLALFYKRKNELNSSLKWLCYAGVLYSRSNEAEEVDKVQAQIRALSASDTQKQYALALIDGAQSHDFAPAQLEVMGEFKVGSEYKLFLAHDLKRFGYDPAYINELATCCAKWICQLKNTEAPNEWKALCTILLEASASRLQLLSDAGEILTLDNVPSSIGLISKTLAFGRLLPTFQLSELEVEYLEKVTAHMLSAAILTTEPQEKIELLKLILPLIQHSHLLDEPNINSNLTKLLVSVFSQGKMQAAMHRQCLDAPQLIALISCVMTLSGRSNDDESLDVGVNSNDEICRNGLGLMEAFGVTLSALQQSNSPASPTLSSSHFFNTRTSRDGGDNADKEQNKIP